MMEPEMVNSLLHRHLIEHDLLSAGKTDPSWRIEFSKLGGRGMFATRDIEPGELIFVDAPLVIGPRCYEKYLPMCINCYKSDCPLFPCDRGCGLPVCSNDCENSPRHSLNECKFLRDWRPTCGSMWSMELLQAVVPIRALSLSDDQRNLIKALEHHPRHPHFEKLLLAHEFTSVVTHCQRLLMEILAHSVQLDLLKKNIKNEIKEDDEKLMIRVCQVLDTGAFETAAIVNETMSISLRGLYPVGALQNHCCTPNTRHHFDRRQLLYTRAAVAIKKGEELTMTYTDLLWDTNLRRQYLRMSKHFDCCCERCSDPLEFGTLLGALRCANLDCYSNLYAKDPLNMETVWICEDCKLRISSKQIKSIRSGIAAIVEEELCKSPRKILKFINGELTILVPTTSSIMMDMKFRIISYFGRADELIWEKLSNAELRTKAEYCQELVHLLDNLGCGDCQKKGLILYEWYCTNLELSRREDSDEDKNSKVNSEIQVSKEDYRRNSSILKKAVEILRDDIAAPDDLSLIEIED